MKAAAKHSTYAKQLADEIRHTPKEYLPMLLRIVRSYRESVTLVPAPESLRRGWREARTGETHPVDRLWDGIDAR
jgi:hypothetical protein